MFEILTQEFNAEELGGFAAVFERYGFGTICCVVIVLGIFWFVKQNTKTQDRLWNKLDELSSNKSQENNSTACNMSKDELREFITTIVREETTKVLNAESTRNIDILTRYNKIAKTIRPMLTKAKDDFHADRISAFVFHNGTHSSHGLPFYKYTCIQEIVNRDKLVTPRIAEQQGAPLSIIDPLALSQLADETGFIIDDANELHYAYPMTTSRLRRDDFRSAVAISICNESEEVVGFIYMVFLEPKSKEELRDIMIRVHERAAAFSSVLDFNNNRDSILHD